ncbi:MAG: flagellar assembly protein FliW [Defluviitaleaceae bacterium]|nr:flagellar assembly protein FliW [Defluviitaleaceae bacterium]
MTIATKNFGEIEINPADAINFEEGLPGFHENNQFVVLFQEPEEGEPNPISFLQSVDNDELCFVLVDMSNFYPEYAPSIHPFIEKEEFDVATTAIYNIATVFEDMSDTTVNLKAPVLINYDNKQGKQIICQGDEFPIRVKLFQPNEVGEGDE